MCLLLHWLSVIYHVSSSRYRCSCTLLTCTAVMSQIFSPGLARYISPIYISLIYIRYFRSKISDIFYIFNFYQVLKNIFNVTHCDYIMIFSLCVLVASDLCPQHFLSVGQLLSDCTSPQQCSVNDKSTSPNMQCTHTHILLFGSKFHIILAMCAQMLDIYIYIYIENIGYFRYFQKYHDIFQPCFSPVSNNSFRQRIHTSDGTDYDIPCTQTKSGKQVFSVSGPSHWNSLPESVRATTDPRSFKKNLKLTILTCALTCFYFVYSLCDFCNA